MPKRTNRGLCSQFELWDFLDILEKGASLTIQDQRRLVLTSLDAVGEGETGEELGDYDDAQ
jgi:hypothetical protein